MMLFVYEIILLYYHAILIFVYKADYEILVQMILFLQCVIFKCYINLLFLQGFFLLHLQLSREFVNKVKNILLSPVVITPTKNCYINIQVRPSIG